MTFKLFQPSGTRASRGADKISIWKRDKISFGSMMVEKNNISRFKSCLMYFDEEVKEIGIKFTNEVNTAAIPVHFYKGGRGIIFCSEFMRSCGVTDEDVKAYDYKVVDGMFIIELEIHESKMVPSFGEENE